jgi:hypothetical protein
MFRRIKHPVSDQVFKDMGCIMGQGEGSLSEMPKTIICCDTIGLGDCVANYLRSLVDVHHKSSTHVTHRRQVIAEAQ